MARPKYTFIYLFFTVIIFILYLQYYYVTLQNKKIDKLSFEVQLVKSPMNYKIKEKLQTNSKSNTKSKAIIKRTEAKVTIINENNNAIVKILIWTRPQHGPFIHLLTGQKAFVKRNCKVKNCYVTTNKTYLNDLKDFDVLLFNAPNVVNDKRLKLPSARSLRQKYVFASIESSDYYPICDNTFDGYFNISWTYKLNSDIFYGYIIVRNNEGEIIGPQKEMHWINIKDMMPINGTVKKKLNSKKKLAAWLVSNCNAPSGRDMFVKKVQSELKILGSDMTIDIYGKCGNYSCGHYKMGNCLEIFQQDYYFYLSFENSFAEDYVTEKLLHALQHYTVPIVYGAANYSRFMPDGIYLNAIELGHKELGKRMIEIVYDKEQYYKFFKWMNDYSFHYVEETPETDFLCKFCKAMNDKDLMARSTVIEKVKEWWNPPVVSRVTVQ